MPIGHRVAEAKAAKAAAAHETETTADEFAEALIADSETPVAPPDAPAPTVTLTMDQFLQALAAVKGSGGFDEAALTRVLQATQQAHATASAQAMQTALNRSNPNYVRVSPFHDAEGNEAIPIYDVYMGPQHSKGKGGMLPKDLYTPAERDLINRFVVGQRKVARGGEWTAEVVQNGSTQELLLKMPMQTQDQRQNLPSFALILRELLDGEVAVNPDRLAERVAELERKLAAAGAAA